MIMPPPRSIRILGDADAALHNEAMRHPLRGARRIRTPGPAAQPWQQRRAEYLERCGRPPDPLAKEEV
jgi:hypothetical protein